MIFSFTLKQSLLEYLPDFLDSCPHKTLVFYLANLVWLLKELLFTLEQLIQIIKQKFKLWCHFRFYGNSKGDNIAQLLLLPYVSINSSNDVRMGGFGSTDQKESSWTSLVSEFARLTINIKVNGKRFSGLLDTGSDITIISKHLWPKILACTKNFLPDCKDFSNQSTRCLSEYSNLSMWRTRRPTP